MRAPLLEIGSLSVSYGPGEVLRGISLSLSPGRILGLVGESGCGKTTLLKAVQGLLGPGGRISGGAVLFEGRDMASLSKEGLRSLRGARISSLSQNPAGSLNPTRTIGAQCLETIRAHRKSYGRRDLAEMGDLMEALGLQNPGRVLKSYPFELSGGMLQRAAMALAMVMRPSLLLADEPTSALDAIVQAQAVSELMRLRERYGTAIILVSHNIAVVAKMSDQAGVMYAGELVELGEAASVLSNPLHPYTRALIAASPRLDGSLPLETPGAPPPPGSIVSGCGFYVRCPDRAPKCLRWSVSLAAAGSNREVACALAAS